MALDDSLVDRPPILIVMKTIKTAMPATIAKLFNFVLTVSLLSDTPAAGSRIPVKAVLLYDG